VAIAGVIAMEPELLILDEPTAGLDPAGRAEILANIESYRKAKNATVMMVSHSMNDVARLTDRLLVMNGAHLAMDGTPAEVFARAEELLSAGLDVPQVTRLAMELRRRGLNIDPAVYTAEDLERQLLRLREEGGVC
jgi:energy-coupling factor transport system ATP-binding protein